MPVPNVSKLPELLIFGNPLPKSQFSAVSTTVFYANRITSNIWPTFHGPLCHIVDAVNLTEVYIFNNEYNGQTFCDLQTLLHTFLDFLVNITKLLL